MCAIQAPTLLLESNIISPTFKKSVVLQVLF